AHRRVGPPGRDTHGDDDGRVRRLPAQGHREVGAGGEILRRHQPVADRIYLACGFASDFGGAADEFAFESASIFASIPVSCSLSVATSRFAPARWSFKAAMSRLAPES